jgi:hypothetical protein
MSSPWFSRPAEVRRELALELVGEVVEVDVDPFRDGTVSTIVGRLVSVASLVSGTTPDVVVVRRYAGNPAGDIAVSIAQVRTIRNVDTPEGRLESIRRLGAQS